MDDQLEARRARIDAIDDQLLDLIAQRTAIAAELAQAKPPGGLALRPAREVKLLRRLMDKAGARLDADAVMEVWRALIAANLRQQQTLEAVVSGRGDGWRLFDLTRRHFGASVKISRMEDFRAALNRALEEPGVVVTLPWPGGTGPGGWWPILNERRYHDLGIFGALPQRSDADPEAALVATRPPIEPVGGVEHTLAIAFDPHHRTGRALAAADLAGKEIGRARDVVLIRIDTFLSVDDPRMRQAMAGGLDDLRIVGSYAQV